MGLGFSHGEAQFSYSGFHNFRTMLASEIGIVLSAMEFFTGESPKVMERIARQQGFRGCDGWPWLDFTPEGSPFPKIYIKYGMPWKKINDPIKHLLKHSDSDGQLTPDECISIAPRLRELISDWPDGFYKIQGHLLAEGMEEAVKANEPLRFC